MKDLSNTHINANYRKGSQLYTGSLWFYNDSFEYKAKSVNSTLRLGKIPYTDIKNIKLINTFGVVPNGILIELKNGAEYMYVISNRKAVVNFLGSKII